MEQMSRSYAREKAFEIIFAINLSNMTDYELDCLKDELKDHKKHMKYIRTVVCGVRDSQEELDGIISQNLGDGWSINRLSKMSLAILRLAVYEIKHMEDIPVNVSINEAVELSKKYGDDGESQFINGILGKISS